MKAFVRQKRIKHVKVYGNSSHHKKGSGKNFFLKLFAFLGVKFLWIVIGVFILFYGIVFLFKHTLFVPEYRIQKVIYDSGSVLQYDDPYVYKSISNRIKGENYHVVQRNKRKILKGVQEDFPIVSDILMEYIPKSMLRVKVEFFEPNMIIKNQDLLFGVYQDFTFAIYSGNTIGQDKSVLYLPRYASGLVTIDGLFFRQSVGELKDQMDIIYPAFPESKFVAYLPGAERTVIMTHDNKKVFLSNLADVTEQIKNFELLRKYYTGYVELREIDLGSLEKDRVIVKK